MINIGIIGSGFIVPIFLETTKLVKGFRYVGIASPVEEQLKTLKEKYGISYYSLNNDDVLSDPKIDVIYVAVPNGLHYEIAKKALLNNKHVIVEKPFMSSYRQAKELIDLAKSYTDDECREYLQDALNRTVGLMDTPEKNRLDFARIYKAYDVFVKKNGIGAVASRCWPDFFTSFGTPVCSVLAMLNDLGVAAACEADMYGALSMWIGMQLSGRAVFFGDPVSLNEQENTLTFWHCGTAACSLARKDTGACIGEHCNRHIGPTMEFGCEQSDHATVFRIGRNPDGTFRFFIASGKALDRPKQFFGTSTVLEMNGSAETMVYEAVKEGWEPHYAVIYEDVADELEMLAHMFKAEVRRFN